MNTCKRLLWNLVAIACLMALVGTSNVQSYTETVIFKPPYLHLATDDAWKWSPAVAYATLHDNYLVVWENWWPNGHHDISGRLVSASGQLGPEFAVYTSGNNSKQPAVAYDPALDSFLVVWSYDYFGNDSDYDIYARLIPWDGPSDSYQAFVLDGGGDSATKPRLAYATTPNKFLVVWKVEGINPAICGGFFTPPLTYTPLDISSGPELRDFPDVTYNAWQNDFVVAWDEDVGRDAMDLDIYAVRLDVDGVPKGTGEFAVTNSTSNEQHPTVAACFWSDEVLFAWQQQVNQSSNENIFGRVMHGYSGNLDQSYGLYGTTLPQRYPRLACSPDGTQYLLVWHAQYADPYPRWGVGGELIHPGLVVEPAFEVVAPSDERDRLYPAVAFGDRKALVVWQHARDNSGYLDIWGQMLWLNPDRAYLPMLRR
jgi:hypothetical protein